MTEAKTVRLEVRLPERMMEEVKKIAPPDGSGRPNVSQLVRDALQAELQKHAAQGMVKWAKRSQDVLRGVEHEWSVSSSDGVSAG